MLLEGRSNFYQLNVWIGFARVQVIFYPQISVSLNKLCNLVRNVGGVEGVWIKMLVFTLFCRFCEEL